MRWHSATGRAGGTLAGGVDIDWFTGERSFGPYMGGDERVAIARRVAIMAGVRIQLTSGLARTIQVLDLVDPDESTWVPGRSSRHERTTCLHVR